MLTSQPCASITFLSSICARYWINSYECCLFWMFFVHVSDMNCWGVESYNLHIPSQVPSREQRIGIKISSLLSIRVDCHQPIYINKNYIIVGNLSLGWIRHFLHENLRCISECQRLFIRETKCSFFQSSLRFLLKA